MKVYKKDIKVIGKELGINFKNISINNIKSGIEIELEHGLLNSKTNVTNNNIKKTMKIALAHIEEYPDYYKRLKKLEKEADQYWRNKTKPNIWL